MRNLTEIKLIWTIDYQEQSAIIGDFHNIIGYEDIRRSVKIKFKTLYNAYTYSKSYSGVEIKRNGKKAEQSYYQKILLFGQKMLYFHL